MSSRHPSDRTAKGFALILGAARAAGLTSRLSNGNALVQKAEHDELVRNERPTDGRGDT